MALTFKYKAMKRPDGSLVKTPVIPITLIGKTFQLDVLALLDSGADVSAIPISLADVLGMKLDKSKMEETGGIGGKVKTIPSSMNLIVASREGRERYHLRIPVHVILGSESSDVPVLFGRKGFFDQFVITFDEARQRVTLKRVDPRMAA